MADEMKMKLAKQVYNTICEALDNRDWHYGKEEDELLVHFGVNGDDIPLQFIIVVDAERQLIRLMSPLPFKMSESKRIEGAIATCAASYGMADGSFDYDLSDGKIVFNVAKPVTLSIELDGDVLSPLVIGCIIAYTWSI